MKNIKNKILTGITLTAIFISSTVKVNAQSFELGFRYFQTVTDMEFHTSSGGVVKGEATLGYGIGGLIGYNFNNHIGLQAEVIYNSISQKYTDDDVVRDVKLNYINIPLLFALNSGRDKPVNVNLVLGPQLGFNVGSSVSTSGGDDGTVTTEAVLAVKKGDLGFAYGAGVDFGLSKVVRLGVGFRGVYGLIDISDDSKNNTTNSYYILDRAHVKTYAGYIGLSFLIM